MASMTTHLCISDFDGKKEFRKFIEDPEKATAEGSFKICRCGTLGGLGRVAITFFKRIDSIDANNEIKSIRRIASFDLRSLHIVRALGFSKLCIVFEECANSLYRLHQDDPNLVLSNFWNISIGVLNAIHFLHYNNLVHRDIKPANVLVNVIAEQTVFPLLGDFGDLEDRIPSTALNLVGTPHYLAPEALSILAAQDFVLPRETDYTKLDVWAAGLIFWNIANNQLKPEFDIPGYKRGVAPSADLAKKFEATHSAICSYFQDFDHPLFSPMLKLDPSVRTTAEKALAWFQFVRPQE